MPGLATWRRCRPPLVRRDGFRGHAARRGPLRQLGPEYPDRSGPLQHRCRDREQHRFGESRALQFRAEFFNLSNRVNFGNPAAAIDQPTAGILSSADPGRQIQVGLQDLF
jgi:hypothetical protein